MSGIAIRDDVVALARRNVPPRQMLAELPRGTALDHVYAALTAARQSDPSVPRFRSGRPVASDGFTVRVSRAVAEQLVPAADARGMRVRDLLGALLVRIAADGLVDAVLDDGPDR